MFALFVGDFSNKHRYNLLKFQRIIFSLLFRRISHKLLVGFWWNLVSREVMIIGRPSSKLGVIRIEIRIHVSHKLQVGFWESEIRINVSHKVLVGFWWNLVSWGAMTIARTSSKLGVIRIEILIWDPDQCRGLNIKQP